MLPFCLLLAESACLPLKYLNSFAIYKIDYFQCKCKNCNAKKVVLCSVKFAIVNLQYVWSALFHWDQYCEILLFMHICGTLCG